jgi:hypothetical protein
VPIAAASSCRWRGILTDEVPLDTGGFVLLRGDDGELG